MLKQSGAATPNRLTNDVLSETAGQVITILGGASSMCSVELIIYIQTDIETGGSTFIMLLFQHNTAV
jgi:hypothetical protein